MVFLSYLSEAGQYSCFFLYLQKVCLTLYNSTFDMRTTPHVLYSNRILIFSWNVLCVWIQVVGFSLSSVALFISVLCVTSVLAQTLGLSSLMHYCGYKYTIIIGLVVQAIQLFIFGVWTTEW